jgi:hypothetical protein
VIKAATIVARYKMAATVVARYRTVMAEQQPGGRQKAKSNSLPINKAKGISQELKNENAVSKEKGSDIVKPERRDIRPEDVFPDVPKNMGVLNLVQTGDDLSRAIDKQVPKDKGFDVVRNLSQYLIRTEGNGADGTAEGKRK